MVIGILGPTAGGKTAFSVEIAKEFNGEIVSADSVAVYRGFDIGSAKPTKEERQEALFHLVDIVDWNVNYNVGMFQEDSHKVIDKIIEKGKLPIVSGGSGFYAKIAFEGIDSIPEITPQVRDKVGEFVKNDFQGAVLKLLEIDKDFANSIDLKNPRKVSRGLEIFELTEKKPTVVFSESEKPKRPPFKAYCITMDREKLIERINLRVDNMVKAGLFEEVENLLKMGVSPHCSPMTSIGYKETVAYFQGLMTKEEAVERIKIATRQFAKRQYTWFKKYSNVNWVNVENMEIIKNDLKEIV